MKDKKIYLIANLFLVCFLFSCTNKLKTDWEMRSPDGKIVAHLHMTESGQLTYQVSMGDGNEKFVLVEDSPLGIIRKDQHFDTLNFVSHERLKTVGESYNLSTGKRLLNRNHYNEFSFRFKNENGALLDIICRTYDDGFAFKYIFPESDESKYIVERELTGFDLPEGNAWMQPYDKPTAYAPAYERNYEGEMPVGTSSPGEEGWCFPALYEVNNHWVLISEANLKGNFYGSHLAATAENGLYKIVPPLENEAFGYGHVYAESHLPWEMPWRMIIVGDELADILESNLVTHLADSSQINDPSWIKSGRASWAWWSGYLDNTNDTPEKLRKYIDFAHEMSWEYSLIDAGWDYRKGFDLKEMAEYARSRNVKLLLWYNSGGPINRVNAGPRDKMFDPEIRREEMKRIAALGISGVKIDFFSSDKQDFMRLYNDILKDAAEFKLLVNFHGCTVPRGWSRTYPNLIAMESVIGEEGYIYHSHYENGAPLHCTILPFTRNVVGPMDYTPVAFSVQQVPHKTSYGFELALSVVFETGIIHFADQVEMYKRQPAGVLQFLKDVPAAWDDTRLLSGYPGDDVVLARQKGGDWYIGGINGEDINKKIEVDFGFLDGGENYVATIIADGEDNKSFNISTKSVSNESVETIDVLPIGGFSIQLKRIN
ncbi:glycoside hydrolase family 97 catalytic domain-containing protein [Sunxiuqinia sp. A32]|uniref:glycoside hydrolase family 97 catalytic domain-containing protein n=1 Tax=Sunxiuqinia sp. A32 TaxID=3461496 RepID=UPI0040465EFD